MSKFNEENNWWKKSEETDLHYIEYKVQDITIRVGSRPNAYGMTEEEYNSIDGFINVSERFVRHRKDKINIFIPWNEGGNPTFEAVWAFLKTMHYWTDEYGYKNIYIHCDSGTHRAVTMFGLFLHAFHHEDKYKIVDNHKFHKREHLSNPNEYAEGYMNRRMPLLKKFVEGINNSKDSFSHGQEISDYLKGLFTEKELGEYHAERFYNNDLKTVFFHMKYSIKHYLLYVLKRPFIKLHRSIHKKLNTEKGKAYKKYGL